MPSPQITDSIEAAVDRLAAGQLVAIPTETVYGLAADATQPDAVAKVFALKGRPSDHPLIVHCADVQQAWQCAELVTDDAVKLAGAFWPGPLTVILPRAKFLDSTITGGQDSVAIRIPGHPVARELVRGLSRPLVAPSANRFGRVSPTHPSHVVDEFPEADLLVFDGGPCEVGIESTIVDCRQAGRVRILRPGKVTRQQIEQVLGGFARAPEKRSPGVRVSGDLPSHYAPTAQVILVETGQLEDELALGKATDKTLVIALDQPATRNMSGMTWRSVERDTNHYAQNMYTFFREADSLGCDRILVELPENSGLGEAIRDRLMRAAHQTRAN